jgi:hypothetical protein
MTLSNPRFTATIMFFKLSGKNREAPHVKVRSQREGRLSPLPDSQRRNYEH